MSPVAPPDFAVVMTVTVYRDVGTRLYLASCDQPNGVLVVGDTVESVLEQIPTAVRQVRDAADAAPAKGVAR